jgi:hypothetical protein
MFRTISQTVVNYRHCDFNAGTAGRLEGGDRLPWVKLDAASDIRSDNFVPLRALDWQMHVYGEPTADVVRLCAERGVPLQRFSWRSEMERAGFARNAVYLVRPDGYIALADRHGSAARLRAFLEQRHLRPLGTQRAAAQASAASTDKARAAIATPTSSH